MMELRSTLAGRIALTVVATVILLFLALPIVVILVTSFGNNAFGAFPPEAWTLDWYKALFADGSKWPAALSLSALVAALTTVFSLILGVTAATALVRSELPLRSAVYALVLAPLLIPQVVIALGLFLLFEPAAMLGSPIAIALGHTVLASPIAVLILIATLQRHRRTAGGRRRQHGRRPPHHRPAHHLPPGRARHDRRRDLLLHHQLRRVLHLPVPVLRRHRDPAGPGLQRPLSFDVDPTRHRRQRDPHRLRRPRPRPGRPGALARRRPDSRTVCCRSSPAVGLSPRR